MSSTERSAGPKLETLGITRRQIAAARAAGDEALQAMKLHYGGLPYHNYHHAYLVSMDTNMMTSTLSLTRLGRAIGEAAARGHDVVQLKQRGVMEQESAEWLAERLRHKFPAAAIQAAMLAILGTEPLVEDGKFVGQMASRLSYPSRDAEQIALSVASADVGGELYRPTGPYRGHMLYKEALGLQDNDAGPVLDGLAEFQEGQIAFTADYEFPHPYGDAVLGSLRSEVIRYHEKLAVALRAGTIDSWQEVLQNDLLFAREHGADLATAGML